MSPKSSNKSSMRRLPLFAGLLAAALSVSALAQSTEFPTYQVGQNQNASTGPTYSAPLSYPWVVSDGTILTPAGIQVYLSTTTRAKAIALNPLAITPPPSCRWAPHNRLPFLTPRPELCCRTTHHRSATTAAAPPASPIRRTARTCCLARTAATGQPTLPSPASVRRACSQTTLRSAFRWTSTAAAI